jgi:hypothetical protein
VCDFDEGWRAGLSIERVVVMKTARSEDHPYFLILFKVTYLLVGIIILLF